MADEVKTEEVVDTTETPEVEESKEEVVEEPKVEAPKKRGRPKVKKEEVKVEEIATPKKIGQKDIVDISKKGKYFIIKDECGVTYTLPPEEFETLK